MTTFYIIYENSFDELHLCIINAESEYKAHQVLYTEHDVVNIKRTENMHRLVADEEQLQMIETFKYNNPKLITHATRF